MFSLCFPSICKLGYGTLSPKKNWKFQIIEASVFLRAPRVPETSGIEHRRFFLHFACRDSGQLPVAWKLQVPEVGGLGPERVTFRPQNGAKRARRPHDGHPRWRGAAWRPHSLRRAGVAGHRDCLYGGVGGWRAAAGGRHRLRAGGERRRLHAAAAAAHASHRGELRGG